MPTEPSSTRVLVTGATSFIALHCILQLLEQGYRVRGTLRAASREEPVRQTLAKYVNAGDRLEFARADLLQDDGWEQAVRGCESVLHVASPYPDKPPKREEDLIVPAREGTLRVLRAAARGGIKRIVLTSSTAAITAGHTGAGNTFDERDWSNLEGDSDAYSKSKTLAERAAWDFVASLESHQRLELAVINPAYVYGPYLDNHSSTSGELIRKLMRREVPGVARTVVNFADVRDVAAAHLAAMTTPQAAGQRFCCVADRCWMREIAVTLQTHFAGRGYRIPIRELPDFLVRLIALIDPSVRPAVPYLGKQVRISNERIKQVLGWQPRPREEAIIAMAESMIEQGIV